jgi:GNAT superfamily N-acetyltransferase
MWPVYSPPVKIRRLHAGEREQWLELLDGWALLDGWRGGVFFRRPIDHDPAYDDADVWVADDGGRLVSTVQIFPRLLDVGGAAVPLGGIGSVFTREQSRGRGVATALLERALADMRERGLELSLLFSGRLSFYERLGFRSWPVLRELLRPGGPPAAAPHFVSGEFDPERDLEQVAELHARARARRLGVALRDAAAWQLSLALAGNPVEEFRVARARPGGAVLAYLRAARLNAALTVLEHGHADADALAALCAELLGAREPDPLACAERPSRDLRGFAVLPLAAEPELVAALERRGIARQAVRDPTPMLLCLDAPALARRLGTRLGREETPEALLARVLPPARFGYWPADRF